MAALRWGSASARLAGQTESGDRCLVKGFETGTLAAVIDALGHGRRASRLSDQAVEVLEAHADEAPEALMARCHQRLRESPGATISLASFDWRSHCLRWLGVGNVAGIILPYGSASGARPQYLLVRGGVVGDDLPDLDPVIVPLVPGDMLVMATDGIREEFAEDLPKTADPQVLADHILSRHARATDDALVLVTRYGESEDD